VKLLCLILSFYVVLLSLRPCCADNDCQAKIAAKKHVNSKSSPKEKECQGCSPFFACGTCVGFVITKPFMLDLKLVAETPVKIYADYQQPYVHQVSLSIWQPPQLG
jgi:Na+/H+ antiporter NhaD/arsenite permease-like protein